MKLRLLACAGTLALVLGVFVMNAPTAGAGSEFSLIGHQTNIQFVIGAVSSPTPPTGPFNPGDRVLIREDLSRDNAVVGWDNIDCTVTFNDNLLCTALYAINGKGDLHLTALLRGGASQQGTSVFDAIVDGGTFAYRNAHGDAHLTDLANGDTQVTFTLS
jgi:hypothetical protein